MKKLALIVCVLLLACSAYAQDYSVHDDETFSQAFARIEREERQEKLERSQIRINQELEDRLSQPQQYQIRRNGNTLIIEEY